jgi:hypothetical protein
MEILFIEKMVIFLLPKKSSLGILQYWSDDIIVSKINIDPK